MMKQSRKWFVLITIATVVLSTTITCQLWSSLGNIKVAEMSNNQGYYAIDTDTILKSIAQGKTDVFFSQNATPEVVAPLSSKPIQWSQADYFRVAEALSEFVWNEPLEDWNLDNVLFRLDCEDVNSGPQFAAFSYFKIIHTREQESRLVHNLLIDPFGHSVSWQETEYYPNNLVVKRTDLSQQNILAEDALSIAEKNGGLEVRSSAGNACIIYLLRLM
jgi:hypothetical protein